MKKSILILSIIEAISFNSYAEFDTKHFLEQARGESPMYSSIPIPIGEIIKSTETEVNCNPEFANTPSEAQSACSESNNEIVSAKNEAENELKIKAENAAQEKINETKSSCNVEANVIYNECQTSIVQEIEDSIHTLISELKALNQVDPTNLEINKKYYGIKRIQEEMAVKQIKLEELKNSCNTNLLNRVKSTCVEPNLTPGEVGTVESEEKTTETAVIQAKAQLEKTIPLNAPEIIKKRDNAEDNYSSFHSLSNSVEVKINNEIALANSFLSSLQNSGLIQDDSQGSIDTNPGFVTDESKERSPSPATGAGGGSSGGVSSDQVMANAQSGSYGPSGGGNGETNGPSSGGGTSGAGASNGGSAQGGMNGLMSGLSSLGSVFGKSGGGFGNDSSYGSNRSSSSRYNSNSGSTSNYPIPRNNNSSYNSKLDSKSANFAQPTSARPFTNGGTPSDGNFGNTAPTGGNSNLSNSSNSKGGFNNSSPKPGLFSRLFGKKDKTLLGKNMNRGSSGGFKSSSGRSGSGFDDSSSRNLLLKSEERTFDPNKYAPSKAAEERAYARATGRKIASHTSESSDKNTPWPNDISRDKRRNMFSKVTVVHKMNLDLNK